MTDKAYMKCNYWFAPLASKAPTQVLFKAFSVDGAPKLACKIITLAMWECCIIKIKASGVGECRDGCSVCRIAVYCVPHGARHRLKYLGGVLKSCVPRTSLGGYFHC